MYTLITLFYVALAGIIVMVVLKHHEAKSGRQTIVSRLGRGTDHVFYAIFRFFNKVVSYFNRKNFFALVQWIAYHILFRTRKVYVEVKHQALQNPYGKKMIDAVRGRGEIKDHGASFFLRRIGEK